MIKMMYNKIISPIMNVESYPNIIIEGTVSKAPRRKTAPGRIFRVEI